MAQVATIYEMIIYSYRLKITPAHLKSEHDEYEKRITEARLKLEVWNFHSGIIQGYLIFSVHSSIYEQFANTS